MVDKAPRPPLDEASRGFEGVALTFGRALRSQFQGPMLLALLLPFAVALLGAIVLLWVFWTPLSVWLEQLMFSWEWVSSVDAWLVTLGVASLKLWLIPVFTTLMLLPLSGILGLVVAALFIMPWVSRHVSKHDYRRLERKGSFGLFQSVWNAFWVTVVFVMGWLLTMPLWLFPPMAIILPILWWTFAFTKLLRLDALSEHTTPEERRLLIKRHNGGYWMLGFVCSLINLLPPAWIFLPVFSALLFSHFTLENLRRLRAEEALRHV